MALGSRVQTRSCRCSPEGAITVQSQAGAPLARGDPTHGMPIAGDQLPCNRVSGWGAQQCCATAGQACLGLQGITLQAEHLQAEHLQAACSTIGGARYQRCP